MPTVVPFNVTNVSECSTELRGNEVLGWSECGCGMATNITAHFPYAQNVMHGLTLATIVTSGLSFTTAEDVSNATVYGPAVIEVD